MITLLCGENIVQSRKRLTEILEKARLSGIETVNLNGQKISFSELRSALESGSLFGKTKIVVVENFLSLPKSKEKERILEYLENGKFDNDLLFWEPKEIKTGIPQKAKKEVFKLNSLIFQFLESLKPDSPKKSLELLTELKQKEEPEMIFYMLIRQFRILLVTRDLGVSGLSELSSWQQGKFLAQASSFDLEKLKRIYRQLLEIDLAQKVSGDPFLLSSRLDLLVASF